MSLFFFPECSCKKDHTAWAKFKLLLFFFPFVIGTVSLVSARAIRSWLYLVIIHHYLEVLVCHWKVSIMLTECYCFASFSSPYQTCIFINMFWAASSAEWRAANWDRTDLGCEQWLYHINTQLGIFQLTDARKWQFVGGMAFLWECFIWTDKWGTPFRSKKKFWSKEITSTPALGLRCWSMGLKTCHLQEFSTDRCQILALGWSNPLHQCSPGR